MDVLRRLLAAVFRGPETTEWFDDGRFRFRQVMTIHGMIASRSTVLMKRRFEGKVQYRWPTPDEMTEAYESFCW